MDQGFGVIISILLFTNLNDKMKPIYKRMTIKVCTCKNPVTERSVFENDPKVKTANRN